MRRTKVYTISTIVTSASDGANPASVAGYVVMYDISILQKRTIAVLRGDGRAAWRRGTFVFQRLVFPCSIASSLSKVESSRRRQGRARLHVCYVKHVRGKGSPFIV